MCCVIAMLKYLNTSDRELRGDGNNGDFILSA